MNGFDYVILNALSRPQLHGQAIDRFLLAMQANLLLKGGVVVAMIWWVWFRQPDPSGAEGEAVANRSRRRIICGLFAAILATAIARAVHLSLPFRTRPINYPELFHVPSGLTESDAEFFRNDSSFPSDHAALFYALATLIAMISPGMGIFSFIYVTAVIILPRLYLMFHYPTDIIAGGLIGFLCVYLAIRLSEEANLGRRFLDQAMEWSKRSPGAFYALMFVSSFCVAELFQSARSIARVGPLLRKLFSLH